MEEKIKKLVLDLYGISITSETKISEVVDDSLTALDFLFELENGIGRSLDHKEILELKTFGDLIKVLENA